MTLPLQLQSAHLSSCRVRHALRCSARLGSTLPGGVLCFLAACSSSSAVPVAAESAPSVSSPSAAGALSSAPPAPSSSATSQNPVKESECVTRATGGISNDFVKTNGVVCDPVGFPFVRSAVALAVGPAEALLRQPEPGTLCVKGTASTTSLAWGLLGLEFSTKNLEQTQIFSTFDAAALGITQLGFTLTGAPKLGLNVDSASTIKLSCPESPGDCQTPDEGFLLMNAAGSTTVLSLTEDGDYVAPFSNFQQTRSDGSRFDTTVLEHFSFRTIGDFDFCIKNFRLLNSNNEAINP